MKDCCWWVIPELSSPSLESPRPIIWSVCAITSSRWGQKCWPKGFCSIRSRLLLTTWWWRLKNTWLWVPVRLKPASLAGTSPLRLQPLPIPVKDMTGKRYVTDDDVIFRTKHVKFKSMGKYNKRCLLQDGYAEHVQPCHIFHRQNFIVLSLRFLCEAQNFSATPRRSTLWKGLDDGVVMGVSRLGARCAPARRQDAHCRPGANGSWAPHRDAVWVHGRPKLISQNRILNGIVG